MQAISKPKTVKPIKPKYLKELEERTERFRDLIHQMPNPEFEARILEEWADVKYLILGLTDIIEFMPSFQKESEKIRTFDELIQFFQNFQHFQHMDLMPDFLSESLALLISPKQ